MPVPMDIGRLKDVQDWDDQTQEEEWHEVGAVGDSCHRCGGVGHYSSECPTAKGKGKGKSKGKGFDGARAEKWQWPGKGKSIGKGESKTGSPVQCYGCGEYGHRVAIARNGRPLRSSKMRKLKPRKKPCKWLVSTGMSDV